MGVLQGRAERLRKHISTLKPEHLPHTIGVFGTWGSGKTSTLAYLDEELEKHGHPVVYFNAYKYAGFMEVVPEANRRQLTSRIVTLSAKHAGSVGKWVESKVGVNPVAIVQDLQSIQDAMNGPTKERQAVLEAYYTKVDRIQDTLKAIFKAAGSAKPTVVLIDELDRCDPGEAFDAMKQLRVLFSMRRLPIVFVMVANPEPIGLAIRHQYGLEGAGSEYEAGRILEKFVDTIFDLGEPLSLGKYVEGLWDGLAKGRMELASFVVGLDARTDRRPDHAYGYDVLANALAVEAMRATDPLYANLRALRKTLALSIENSDTSVHLWTLWHLTQLKQSNPLLRRHVSRVADSIKNATEQSLLRVLRVLAEQGQLDGKKIRPRINLESYEVHTPYAIYYRAFWDSMKAERTGAAAAGGEHVGILDEMLGSVPVMMFLCQLSLIALSGNGVGGVQIVNPYAKSLSEAVPGFLGMGHYGWLLAEY